MRQKAISLFSILITLFIGITGTIIVYRYFLGGNEIIEKKINNITLTESDTIASSVNEVYDATVYIETYNGTNISSTGSGFIYKTDEKFGYIMTNNHVVENATKVTIINTSGQLYDAVIVGTDIYSDLAVLKIDIAGVRATAKIGDSTASLIGDTIFTVGSPLGIEYMNSITKGTLSGKDRTVTVALSSGSYLMEVIQVDAAINPGNSGGPLCNLKGEVIGINSLKLVEDEIEGMGFAIPIETAMMIVEQLELGKAIERPYIGVYTIAVNDTWQLYKNGIYLDNTITSGIVITKVEEESVAQEVGLQKGDIITEMDGTTVKSSAHFKFLLYKHSVGDTVKIKYYRNKEYKEIKVLLNQVGK